MTLGNDVTQQINLYLPEFRPRNDWMTGRRLLAILVAVCVLAALLSGLDYGRRYALQQELAAVKGEADSQQAVTEQIERSLASRATDQALLSEVSARQESLDQLNGTLEILRTSSQGNLNGFSEHLKNLSSASFDGLWLTDISIKDGGTRATLQGYALESAMVPSFIDRLSRGWSRSEGWRFNRMTGATGDAWPVAAAVDGDATQAGVLTGGVESEAQPTATGLAEAADPLLRDAYRFTLETQ